MQGCYILCFYFSKSEDEFSLAMRQAAKEVFEHNLSNYKTMQRIVRAYVNKLEFSGLEESCVT